jgi:hypothetical protein
MPVYARLVMCELRHISTCISCHRYYFWYEVYQVMSSSKNDTLIDGSGESLIIGQRKSMEETFAAQCQTLSNTPLVTFNQGNRPPPVHAS